MRKQERIKYYVKELNCCVRDDDTEGAHGDADDILCSLLKELGYGRVVEEYDNVNKWYG